MKNKQIWGRIGQIVLVLLGISFVTFALVMLSPGDPVRQMIAGNEDIVVSQVEIDALRHELGLDAGDIDISAGFYTFYVGVFTAFGYLFCCQTQQCF